MAAEGTPPAELLTTLAVLTMPDDQFHWVLKEAEGVSDLDLSTLGAFRNPSICLSLPLSLWLCLVLLCFWLDFALSSFVLFGGFVFDAV